MNYGNWKILMSVLTSMTRYSQGIKSLCLGDKIFKWAYFAKAKIKFFYVFDSFFIFRMELEKARLENVAEEEARRLEKDMV